MNTHPPSTQDEIIAEECSSSELRGRRKSYTADKGFYAAILRHGEVVEDPFIDKRKHSLGWWESFLYWFRKRPPTKVVKFRSTPFRFTLYIGRPQTNHKDKDAHPLSSASVATSDGDNVNGEIEVSLKVNPDKFLNFLALQKVASDLTIVTVHDVLKQLHSEIMSDVLIPTINGIHSTELPNSSKILNEKCQSALKDTLGIHGLYFDKLTVHWHKTDQQIKDQEIRRLEDERKFLELEKQNAELEKQIREIKEKSYLHTVLRDLLAWQTDQIKDAVNPGKFKNFVLPIIFILISAAVVTTIRFVPVDSWFGDKPEIVSTGSASQQIAETAPVPLTDNETKIEESPPEVVPILPAIQSTMPDLSSAEFQINSYGSAIVIFPNIEDKAQVHLSGLEIPVGDIPTGISNGTK